jgi:hypothetical protein
MEVAGPRANPPSHQLCNICLRSDICRERYISIHHIILSDIYLDIYICQWVRVVIRTAKQDVPIYISPATVRVRVRSPDTTSLVRGPGCRLRPVRQLVNPAATRRSTPLADWPILALPPTGQPPPLHDPSGPRSPPPPPNPPRPPSQLAHPPPPCRRSPEGEPLWHHRAARGLPGVGYPPGARPSTTPARAGVVHNRPRDTATPP